MRKLGRGLLWIAAILLAVVVFLRAFVLTVWTVPDDPVLAAAIAPTLRAGDTVVVLRVGAPSFGDLVRCTDPEDASKFVIARIAGFGRDIVETEGARLLVNGQHYDSERSCVEATFTIDHPTKHEEIELRCDVVRMGSGFHYRGSGRSTDRRARAEVGSDQVFLLSDNRIYHDDSRDFGTQPTARCRERLIYRLWSKAGWQDDKSRMTIIH